MLIKSKEEIAWDAYGAAKRVMETHANQSYNGGPTSVMGQLTELIALAVQAGVAEMLKNTYTNEEFEQDLGLKT